MHIMVKFLTDRMAELLMEITSGFEEFFSILAFVRDRHCPGVGKCNAMSRDQSFGVRGGAATAPLQDNGPHRPAGVGAGLQAVADELLRRIEVERNAGPAFSGDNLPVGPVYGM